MDDFQRMMEMEGVRRLDSKDQGKGRRSAASPPVQAPSRQNAPAAPTGHAWASGERARVGLDTAIERLSRELRAGKGAWALGIGQDGRTTSLSATSGAASLIAAADRLDLRLIVLGGAGWTFVMHPQMGVATLDRDPEEQP